MTRVILAPYDLLTLFDLSGQTFMDQNLPLIITLKKPANNIWIKGSCQSKPRRLLKVGTRKEAERRKFDEPSYSTSEWQRWIENGNI